MHWQDSCRRTATRYGPYGDKQHPEGVEKILLPANQCPCQISTYLHFPQETLLVLSCRFLRPLPSLFYYRNQLLENLWLYPLYSYSRDARAHRLAVVFGVALRVRHRGYDTCRRIFP